MHFSINYGAKKIFFWWIYFDKCQGCKILFSKFDVINAFSNGCFLISLKVHLTTLLELNPYLSELFYMGPSFLYEGKFSLPPLHFMNKWPINSLSIMQKIVICKVSWNETGTNFYFCKVVMSLVSCCFASFACLFCFIIYIVKRLLATFEQLYRERQSQWEKEDAIIFLVFALCWIQPLLWRFSIRPWYSIFERRGAFKCLCFNAKKLFTLWKSWYQTINTNKRIMVT